MPICAICGEQVEKVTIDHIPPQGLFGKNRGHPLIEVPACDGCNGGSSKDDEYFKLLAVEWEASAHPVAARVMDSVWRSLQLPKKQPYRTQLLLSTKRIDLLTPGGLFIKPGGELQVNVGRIGRTATKIVKGLYYHIHSQPVPKGYFAYSNLLQVVLTGSWPDEFKQRVEDLWIPTLLSRPPEVIGPDVFRYWWGVGETDQNIGFCYWELYNRYQFFGFIGKTLDAQNAESAG